uniref:IBH1-like N-terminal domain-containing protein n=1 Tax=Oryza punctata TaxID=4537 RepID=A0A0E0LE62_ORYPU
MSFKQAFLKNLLLSLQDCSTTKPLNAMSLHERKRAVKSSADVAMATAHGGGGARWPKAIILQQPAAAKACKARRCRRIVRRCCGEKTRSGRRRCAAAGGGGEMMARRLVRRRAMALRKVIPGGDAMDEVALLREAMDYVVHLRAQVDVLRRVSEAVQRRSTSPRYVTKH